MTVSVQYQCGYEERQLTTALLARTIGRPEGEKRARGYSTCVSVSSVLVPVPNPPTTMHAERK